MEAGNHRLKKSGELRSQRNTLFLGSKDEAGFVVSQFYYRLKYALLKFASFFLLHPCSNIRINQVIN